jgi:hypothetical protein
MALNPNFPNRLDFEYWTIRQPRPSWAKELPPLRIRITIDGLINSREIEKESLTKKENLLDIANLISFINRIQKGEGKWHPPGYSIKRLIDFADMGDPARGRNWDNETRRGIVARRWIKKMKHLKLPLSLQMRLAVKKPLD